MESQLSQAESEENGNVLILTTPMASNQFRMPLATRIFDLHSVIPSTLTTTASRH